MYPRALDDILESLESLPVHAFALHGSEESGVTVGRDPVLADQELVVFGDRSIEIGQRGSPVPRGEPIARVLPLVERRPVPRRAARRKCAVDSRHVHWKWCHDPWILPDTSVRLAAAEHEPVAPASVAAVVGELEERCCPSTKSTRC